jgi:hypothetical protein
VAKDAGEIASRMLTPLMRPEKDCEGIGYSLSPSQKGGAVEVQQLRDPYVFEEHGSASLSLLTHPAVLHYCGTRLRIVAERVKIAYHGRENWGMRVGIHDPFSPSHNSSGI